MADWTFEDVLAAIQSLPSIPTSVLQSVDRIHLGDIRFVKMHTTLQMCTVPLTILEKWVENRSFNPEHMVEGDYSCSTSYIAHIESRCLVQRHREHGYPVDCPLVQSTTWADIFHSSPN